VAYQLRSTPTFDRAFKRLPDDLQGLQKYRIGDCRVLFWVDHARHVITLYTVEHRSRIYKEL
jgi:mRNA-degrading endonuclease RelE of RelBE toxin-antitoxin system